MHFRTHFSSLTDLTWYKLSLCQVLWSKLYLLLLTLFFTIKSIAMVSTIAQTWFDGNRTLTLWCLTKIHPTLSYFMEHCYNILFPAPIHPLTLGQGDEPGVSVWVWGVHTAFIAAWCTHREWHRSQNCDNVLTSGLVRYEAVLQNCRTSPVWGRVPTCDSAHSWWLYSAASLQHQATGTMTCYPTQLHYLDSEPTSPWHILIMPSVRLGSNRYQFKSHWFISTRVRKLWCLDSNPQSSDIPISQSGRQTLDSLGHPDWSTGVTALERHCRRCSHRPCWYWQELILWIVSIVHAIQKLYNKLYSFKMWSVNNSY